MLPVPPPHIAASHLYPLQHYTACNPAGPWWPRWGTVVLWSLLQGPPSPMCTHLSSRTKPTSHLAALEPAVSPLSVVGTLLTGLLVWGPFSLTLSSGISLRGLRKLPGPKRSPSPIILTCSFCCTGSSSRCGQWVGLLGPKMLFNQSTCI